MASSTSRLEAEKFLHIWDDPQVINHRKLVEKFMLETFCDQINPIIKIWFPRAIIELNQFYININPIQLANESIKICREELKCNFPLPMNEKMIEELKEEYQQHLSIYCKGAYYWPKCLISMNQNYYQIHNKIYSLLIDEHEHLWRLNTAIHLYMSRWEYDHTHRLTILYTIVGRIKSTLGFINRLLFNSTWSNYAQERIIRLTTIFNYPQSLDARIQMEHFEKIYFHMFSGEIAKLIDKLISLHTLLLKNMNEIKPMTENDSQFDSISGKKIYT